MESLKMKDGARYWARTFQLAYDIASGLAEIHKLGFLHRDLHPGNILFHQDSAVIIDVGLSKPIEELHEEKGCYGRLEYLCPESFERHRSYTEASDVYCLGTLLWELVTRVPPQSCANAAIRDRSDKLREDTIPDAPPWYNDLIVSCWNPVADERPSAEAVRDILFSVVGQFNSDLDADYDENILETQPFSPETMAFVTKRQEAYKQELEESAKSSEFYLFDGGSSRDMSTTSNSYTSRFYSSQQLLQNSIRQTKSVLLESEQDGQAT